MSRTHLVSQLKNANRTALALARAGSTESERAQKVVDNLNEALAAMGEGPITLGVIAPAPAGPRFGRTPPKLYGSATIEAAKEKELEKKSAVVVEPKQAPQIDEVEAAVQSGAITEVDNSKATLEEIASSTNRANLDRFKTVEAIQELTKLIGGTPDPEKSPSQQATILKNAAKEALKNK